MRKPEDLTRNQKRLLQYPPTEETWLCPNHTTDEPNAGSQLKCCMCGTPKPRKPKKLWPKYEEAREQLEAIQAYQDWKEVKNVNSANL